MQQCLMLGAGFAEPKRRLIGPNSQAVVRWWTVDINPEAKPNRVFDLEQLEMGTQLPYETEFFDEIHAYEILEHFGHQGNYRGFFQTFKQLWRVLKVDGLLIATVPALGSPWLWGDPGHTRVISHETISFLTKEHYDQLGNTAATDYRRFVDPCWWVIEFSEVKDGFFAFVLRKVR